MAIRRKPKPKEQAFIEAYIETGNAGEAATKAGYNPATASVRGCQLRKQFAQEISELVAANFRDKSPRMAKIIEDLAERSENDQVRYKAASDYLDRGGFKPTDKYEEVKPDVSPEETLQRLRATLPSVLEEVWPSLTQEEQDGCLKAMGIDPAMRKAAGVPLKVVGGSSQPPNRFQAILGP